MNSSDPYDQNIEAMILRGRVYNQNGEPGDRIFGRIADDGKESGYVQFPRKNIPKNGRNTYITFAENKPVNALRNPSPRRNPNFLNKQ